MIFVGATTAEILELSDKVLVMKDGRIAQRYDLSAGDRPTEGVVVWQGASQTRCVFRKNRL